MRAVIGVIPLYDDEKNSYWMLPGYMKVIESCGGLPVMLPLTKDEAVLKDAYDLCDGILFTGGHDVNPEMYGQKPSPHCGMTCIARDDMETRLLDQCLTDDKPLLGICRGIQLINAHLGGTLYQDLPTEFESGVEHHMSPPYDRKAHTVTILENTKLAEIMGSGSHDVNSYHHQAIKEPADALEEMAVSEDGLVEAIAVKGHRFAIGVQWHPEFSYESDAGSTLLIKALVEECQKRKESIL
ncbi:MAG: gamma-glutamyl-gamma-aminobutyrate hydrolase family protein [Lachnospiraceae bacterium]|nr:gamma-glutamyl-gamma-aminobutyrate hydrolase family protein [Lachnospiraceae bacterium]